MTKLNDTYWIQTYSGKRFDLLNPTPDMICLTDLAKSLSNICRFNGHCEFYSVAQHSVLVSQACPKEDQFWGLLHDQSEAYYNDISSPLKSTPHFRRYKELEHKLEKIIFEKFGLFGERPTSVKVADLRVLSTEALSLLKKPLHPDWVLPAEPLPFKIKPLSPKKAEALFLHTFRSLTTKKQYDKWIKE